MKFRGKIVDPHCMKQFYSEFETYIQDLSVHISTFN